MGKGKRSVIAVMGAALLLAIPCFGLAATLPAFTSITDFVNRVLCPIALWMFYVLIVLSVVLVLWAAYLYMFSGGDAEKVKTANKTLTYTAVAVIVALVARTFPLIVGSLLGATGLTTCQ